MRRSLGTSFCLLLVGATVVFGGRASAADPPVYSVELRVGGLQEGVADVEAGDSTVRVLPQHTMRALTRVDGQPTAGLWVEFYNYARDTRQGPENAWGGTAYRDDGHFRFICSATSNADGIAECVDERGPAHDYRTPDHARAEAEWKKGELDREIECERARWVDRTSTCWVWEDGWTRASLQIDGVEVARSDTQFYRWES